MPITPRITIHRLSMADPLPTPLSYGLKPGISRPRAVRLSISAEYALQWPGHQNRDGGTGVHATGTSSSGIRYRGSQARTWRGVCAMGAGPRTVDRWHRLY